MKFENFDYHFKIRNSYEQALNLAVVYNNLAYSNFDKNKLLSVFKLDSSLLQNSGYITQLKDVVDKALSKQGDKINQICDNLQIRWATYRDKYINIISKVLGIDFNMDVVNHLYCYLQLIPINEVELVDNVIYLNANKGEDEIFKNFIILLTKKLLLNRWKDNVKWNFSTDFDSKNKIFLFAEIAVDAIFDNSDLREICTKPSYKYFYNLTNEEGNIMDMFSRLYNNVELDDFFDKVYMFVYSNYQNLSQFKHYLY